MVLVAASSAQMDSFWWMVMIIKALTIRGMAPHMLRT
jgi:hypothetical protein